MTSVESASVEPDLALARQTAQRAHAVIVKLKEMGLPDDLDGDLASLSTDLGDLWGAQSGSGGLGHRHSLMDGRRRGHR